MEEYVWNDFESPPWSVLYRFMYNLKAVRETGSELFWGLLGRDYRYIDSPHGFAVALHGVDQTKELVTLTKHCWLRYLYVYCAHRDNECLDFRSLTPLRKLRGLSIGDYLKTSHASSIEKLLSLRELFMSEIDEPLDLTKLPELRDLKIMASPHLESVWQLPSLYSLGIDHHRHADLAPASALRGLVKLVVSESTKLTSLNGIAALRNLRFLGLYVNRNIRDLDSISTAESLEYLVIESCSKLENIDAVKNLPNLKYLEVRACRRLNSVAPFPAMPNLTHVFFIDCGKLDRPIKEIVAALPNLKYFWKVG